MRSMSAAGKPLASTALKDDEDSSMIWSIEGILDIPEEKHR